MCILRPEIEHLVLDRLESDVFLHPKDCQFYELVNLSLVSKAFKMRFYPILQEINADPVRWAISREHKALFRYWFEVARVWASADDSDIGDIPGCGSIGYRPRDKSNLFDDSLRNHKEARKFPKNREKYDYYSRFIFSLAGECGASRDFVKFLWMLLCKNGFKSFTLEDYFLTAGEKPIIDIASFRKEMLKDNSAHNVLYHIEWNYMCARV